MICSCAGSGGKPTRRQWNSRSRKNRRNVTLYVTPSRQRSLAWMGWPT
jgi:hypothetical protein